MTMNSKTGMYLQPPPLFACSAQAFTLPLLGRDARGDQRLCTPGWRALWTWMCKL